MQDSLCILHWQDARYILSMMYLASLQDIARSSQYPQQILSPYYSLIYLFFNLHKSFNMRQFTFLQMYLKNMCSSCSNNMKELFTHINKLTSNFWHLNTQGSMLLKGSFVAFVIKWHCNIFFLPPQKHSLHILLFYAIQNKINYFKKCQGVIMSIFSVNATYGSNHIS